MSELRRAIIHAAFDANDNDFAAYLIGRRYVSRVTLHAYAAYYGI